MWAGEMRVYVKSDEVAEMEGGERAATRKNRKERQSAVRIEVPLKKRKALEECKSGSTRGVSAKSSLLKDGGEKRVDRGALRCRR
jgi:hypothetical protein